MCGALMQLCETIGTFLLIWTVLMMELRVELLPQSAKDNGYLVTQALIIGFMVVGLIMG
jgi:glycerol uptake facilitator-like aquaporin